MRSEVGMDYAPLRDLLAAGLWFDAYQETKRVMRTVAREKVGYMNEGRLYIEHIQQFPCLDLRTIDQLWGDYSNGHFGFSVQKRIYQSLGGTQRYSPDIWQAFCDHVGWPLIANDHELIFNINALPGHLPAVFNVDLVAFDSYDGFAYWVTTGQSHEGLCLFGSFFKLAEICKL
jgi:hypothetical protein